MSRFLSILVALFALLYVVIAIPVPRDNALELREFSDEELAHATRDYVDSLDGLDRRKFKLKGALKKFKSLAKTGLSIAGKFNPALGVASQFLGRREVEDEELERRKFKLKGALKKFKSLAKTGLSIAGKFNPALGAASQFLGRRDIEDDEELSLRDVEDELVDELTLRDVEDLEELLARDDEEELDLRDVSDEDLALTVRSVWPSLSDVERRGIFDSIRNAANRIKSKVQGAASFVGAHAGSARSILGGAAGLAGKFGGARGRALSRGLQTANRAVGKAHSVSSRIAYRDVEDDE